MRTAEDGVRIDAAGGLPDGSKFDGAAGLKKALLSNPDLFFTTFTEKLLTYALGRGLEPVDLPVVRNIMRGAAKNNYPMQSIILGIAQSSPFQMRTKLKDNRAVNSVAQTATTSIKE